MVSFATLLPPTLFSLCFIPITRAVSTYKHSTHRRHYVGAKRSLKVDAFHPESIFQTYGVEGEEPFPGYGPHRRSFFEPGGAAVSFLASKLSIPEDSVHLRNSAQGQVANHAFLVQKIDGVPVANAVGNVAFNGKGKVSSFSTSFVKHTGAADINPSISRGDAIATAERLLDGTYYGRPTKLEYFVRPDGFAALTYVIQIRNKAAGTWYEAFVDAHDNTLLSVTDYVRKATYWAIPLVTVTDGDPYPDGFLNITDPQLLEASPNGWHQEFNTATNHTNGNNAVAFTGLQLIDITAETSPGDFYYVADLTQEPSTPTNVQAAITNAFYVVNMCHDFFYIYGFTEATFNFQTNNFNKTDPDMGYDRILVSVQDPRGTNGINFAVLPDGQSSEMQMYLFTDLTPNRDSALQNDLIIHEYQHGANNRMTGGGTASCYQTNEAMALDEGYSDAMADASSQGSETCDYVFGAGVSNGIGLRKYPYSTSRTTNPLLYSSLQSLTDPHEMGEVWANVLHNVYAELVDTYGWSWDATTNSSASMAGNIIFFHLLFDALISQPCNPTHTQARDSWIQAYANRYDAYDDCVMWRAFASRGLGVHAAQYNDAFDVPATC